MNKVDKALNEWIKFYELKTKQKVELGNGFHLVFLPDKGFCNIKICRELGALLVREVCGDGHFWDEYCDNMAEKNDLKTVCTFLCRDIKVLARVHKMKLISEKGRFYKFLDRNGKLIEAYPYNNDNLFMIKYVK